MTNRLAIRRSTTKAIPEVTDLLDSELAYSFVSNQFFIKNPITGAIDVIGGKSFVDDLSRVNKVPIATNDVVNIFDDTNRVNGNVLSNDIDPENTTILVTSIKYNNVVRAIDSLFQSNYGTMIISSDGSYTFTPNQVAKALNINDVVVEQFVYEIKDINGALSLGNLNITITGKNGSPVVVDDTSIGRYDQTNSGNVLSNDIDPENTTLTVTQWSIDGIGGSFSPGQTVQIPDKGSLTLNSNGNWQRSSISSTSAGILTVRYTITDGTNTAQGTLVIVLQAGAVSVASNPVTTAMTGLRTFNVGPDKTYTELDTVPWATLVAGDVVNIFHRSTPYVSKIGICGLGEANNPIVINGVTDANGNRPIITGANARTASGSMLGNGNNVFSPGNEGFGTLTIKRKPGVGTAFNPRWITIQNLEITGAASGQSFQNADGTTDMYGFSAGIWLQPATDITIRNNKVYGNSNGIFTMAKVGGILEQCQRINVLYNHFHLNGTAGNGTEHNAYIQGYKNVMEGNYFGWLVNGSSGSSLKTRGSQEIIRYNWFDAGARAIDMVQPDGIFDGFVTYPDFGTDYVYGNVIVNDSGHGGGSYRTIHYGGDNEGELDPQYGGGNSPVNYRKHLYFFNNTVFHANPTSQQRQYFLQLSWQDTVADLWNNIIVFRGTGSTVPTLLYWAGILNFRGSNILIADKTIEDRGPETTPAYAVVNRIGSVVNLNPQFMSETAYDFSLAAGSPALDLSSGIPAGISSDIAINFPVEAEPTRQSNGIYTRSVVGLMDLGAFERDISAPPRNPPAVLSEPQYTNTSAFAIGSTVGVIDPTWSFGPTTIVGQWERLNGSVWENIIGETGSDLILTSSHQPQIRKTFTASNSVGTVSVSTQPRTISTQAAATIIELGFGSNEYPNEPYDSIFTFNTPPAVGNLLVAFYTGGTQQTITDNYGNIWVERISLQGNPSYARMYKCFTCVVSNTGTNFIVKGNTNGRWASSLAVYKMNGTLAGVTGEVNNNLNVTYNADTVNQRILAGFSNEGYPDTTAGVILPPYVQDQSYSYGVAHHVLVHGASITSGQNTMTIDHQYGDQMSKIIVRVNA